MFWAGDDLTPHNVKYTIDSTLQQLLALYRLLAIASSLTVSLFMSKSWIISIVVNTNHMHLEVILQHNVREVMKDPKIRGDWRGWQHGCSWRQWRLNSGGKG